MANKNSQVPVPKVGKATKKKLQKLPLGDIIAFALQAQGCALEMEERATTDYLTGIPNGRFFNDRAEKRLKRAFMGGESCAVLMLDIDFFKKVNDTQGHDAGDEVLCSFTQAVKSVLRDDDLFARCGGEEFVILLPCVNGEKALEVTERILAIVEAMSVRIKTDTEAEKDISVTVSIGVALTEDFEYDLGLLKDNADRALYRAKEGGRNRAVRMSLEFKERRHASRRGGRLVVDKDNPSDRRKK